MKKLLCAVCGLAAALCLPAMAAEGEIGVYLDGTPLAFDTAPAAVEGRTLVPVRAIFEALGYQVDWDGGTGITAVSPEHRVELELGKAEMRVDGVSQALDVPPMAVEGRTLVPVRAVAQAAGCDVFWDQERNVALLWTPGALPTHFLYDDFSTDGVYLYAFSFRGTLQISLADQSVRVLPLLGAICQPYGGKLYGRFGSEGDNLAFAAYDLATGEKKALTDKNVGELYVYGDHVYGVLPGVGFGRMDLDGGNVEEVPFRDEGAGIGYFALRDGLLFSPGGWVLDLETGETAARLTSGVKAEGWRDFYTLGGASLSGDRFYVPISFYYSESYPLYPCGIAVYDYKSGAYGFLPVDDVVEDTQAVGDTLYYTVRTGDAGYNTGTLYRLDDWDLPPTVLAEGLYVSGFIVIGDYVYYNRPAYEGEITLDEGMGGATALCRMPADGGEEQVVSFDQHF